MMPSHIAFQCQKWRCITLRPISTYKFWWFNAQICLEPIQLYIEINLVLNTYINILHVSWYKKVVMKNDNIFLRIAVPEKLMSWTHSVVHAHAEKLCHKNQCLFKIKKTIGIQYVFTCAVMIGVDFVWVTWFAAAKTWASIIFQQHALEHEQWAMEHQYCRWFINMPIEILMNHPPRSQMPSNCQGGAGMTVSCFLEDCNITDEERVTYMTFISLGKATLWLSMWTPTDWAVGELLTAATIIYIYRLVYIDNSAQHVNISLISIQLCIWT